MAKDCGVRKFDTALELEPMRSLDFPFGLILIAALWP
jgi:hypothetical protein